MITYILAGTFAQYRYVLSQLGGDERNIRYIYGKHSIMGVRDVVVFQYGTWWERHDAREIMEIVRSRGFSVMTLS